jgi:hypothetical protein
MQLVLRRANLSRVSGQWQDDDYDVFDGERDVGRIFQQADGSWFWGVSFQLRRSAQARARVEADAAKIMQLVLRRANVSRVSGSGRTTTMTCSTASDVGRRVGRHWANHHITKAAILRICAGSTWRHAGGL